MTVNVVTSQFVECFIEHVIRSYSCGEFDVCLYSFLKFWRCCLDVMRKCWICFRLAWRMTESSNAKWALVDEGKRPRQQLAFLVREFLKFLNQVVWICRQDLMLAQQLSILGILWDPWPRFLCGFLLIYDDRKKFFSPSFSGTKVKPFWRLWLVLASIYVNDVALVAPTNITLEGLTSEVFEGTVVEVTCAVLGGKPEAEIMWFRNGQLIQGSSC